jgi:hypothetical protein
MNQEKRKNDMEPSAEFAAQLQALKEKADFGVGEAAVEAMVSNGPRLSEADLDAIARKVADEVIARIDPKDETSRKDEILRVVGDIIIGVAASGIWELLLHAMTHVAHMDGPTGREVSDESKIFEQRLQTVRRELEHGVEGEVAKDLMNGGRWIDEISFEFSASLTKTIREQDVVVEAAQRLATETDEVAGLTKSLSWDITDAMLSAMREKSFDVLVQRSHLR